MGLRSIRIFYAAVGETLVDIHGQNEHLSFLKSRHHIDLLDRYADLLEIREALTTVVNHSQRNRGAR